MIAAMFMISACFVGCKKKKAQPVFETTVTELVVENIVAADRESMYLNYAKNYRWYETCILLENYLDEENDGSIVGISNIFQMITEEGAGFDTKVVMFSHTNNSNVVDVKDGFWVEDFPLNEDSIVITYKQAYERIMQANLPKPHSKHVVLRKEIGPISCNPQYIFGNNKSQIYVDAITGAVTDKSPAFSSDSLGFQKPLGEWP